MASPAPNSAASPPIIAPAPLTTKSKDDMAAITPSTTDESSRITTKEWIIPPRPKPGRKPATDTPPTKRKAQNRAAQRAFRERRAARVGELEEQLEETKEDQQRREQGLRDKIARLEADVQRFNVELHSWRLRCETLDRLAEFESKAKDAALSELKYLRNGSRTLGTDAVPLPPRRPRQKAITSMQPLEIDARGSENLPMTCGGCTLHGPCACLEEALVISTNGCGNCTPTTRCECLEATLKTAADDSMSSSSKRVHSPLAEEMQKRPKFADPSTTLEQDFTDQYSGKPQAITENAMIQTRSSGKSCGLCEAGTYCICADTNNTESEKNENRLPPLLNEVTPPPSESDSDGQPKLTPMQPHTIHRALPKSANPCIDGPGTCQQCLKDPKSGLFCRSLAAMQASSGSERMQACCSDNGPGGGCCKSTTDAVSQIPHLTCADTYKTLSTHRNFEQATDQLNTWLGHLHAVPRNVPGRTPIEVEAASVIGVLKFFDRRFGRG